MRFGFLEYGLGVELVRILSIFHILYNRILINLCIYVFQGQCVLLFLV
ncbi:hypothetical protein BCO_0900013 [Borrelia coriaceae ATCC 43381]|uniref:Uncharacterized protein n=1 Tax=Borrelia coriaceae ATCC 43381 TaxID=1408429 RepID=W5T0Y5_9SPIR|nr:hypothetical protein BCO_0900013 [Borrelia coriaceae ATCC 43381]